MHLVWTSEAIRKLEDIRDYLAVEQQAPKILDHPLSGRQGVPDYDDPGVREVLVNPYRMIYYVQEDVVHILKLKLLGLCRGFHTTWT